MRIGELAELAGVTPRTVRHYHRLGLLPEPVRLANGYRDYGLRHAMTLARIRRLTALGLGLAEVRDVLADESGRELVEVLEELDADLERQQTAIAVGRERLAVLLEQARAGLLPVEGPVSEELAGLLRALGPTESPIAAKDRAHLVLFDALLPEEERTRIFAGLQPLADDPGTAARVEALYRRLDALADAGTGDPRIEWLARELADAMPDEMLRLLAESGREPPEEGEEGEEEEEREERGKGKERAQGLGESFAEFFGESVGEAFLADFAPAQAMVVRRMVQLLAERARGSL
ncbi:MerR family transcriptional regulator [Streptomyces clavuligerus]|nr:MerR family transcriptional regulator [Streptomyces clavuligerus]ANW22029.1 MerR family transcriptional regulator [Streptomyces clavuligerus]AXU16652.1 MerR family transcriptional regulator [Streptomyces clavuligerus]EDY51633.1 MerR-family transcriptional regulator [Streptomyces clavuligerus]MBY6305111.1 MerR family transcriptional regulator [Streptomyces clavuligerus]QCS09418.1 MerR family transcriptional regulator [Streptomyces clavuligerus]